MILLVEIESVGKVVISSLVRELYTKRIVIIAKIPYAYFRERIIATDPNLKLRI